MGKGTRKRMDRQEERRQQIQVTEVQQKVAGRKRLLWIIAAIMIVLAVAVVVLLRIRADVRRQNGDDIRETVIMSTEHFTVDGAMMSYYIHSEMSAYARENSNTITMEGLDPTADLKTQPCTVGNGRYETWYDYFANQATQSVKRYLYLAEGAMAEGITLDADDEAYLDVQIQNVRDQAKAENKTLEAFVAENFGQGVNLDDIRRAMDVQMLGSKLRAHVEAGVSCGDEDLAAYYEQNTDRLSYCDYYTITFVSKIEDGFTQEQIDAYNEGSRYWADGLADCHDVDAFNQYLADYYRQVYEESGQEYSDQDIEASIKTNATMVEEFTYSGDAVSKWALDPSRKVGDTTVIEGENEYAVYLITKAPTRLDYNTRSYRQIVFSKAGYETAVKRREKANEVRDEYAAGEQTEAAFAALAGQYGEDDDARDAGGLCENVRKSDADEKVTEWLYDAGRKPGDTRIVKSSNDTYYLLYYVGEGEPCWKITAAKQLKQNAYDDAYNILVMKMEITVNKTAIEDLPG